jgi:hypothetical protein
MLGNMERKIITSTGNGLVVETMAIDVSHMVNDYVTDHPSEMLKKEPDVIVDQLSNGLSVIITSFEGNPRPKVLFHASLYPNFNSDEELFLGCQVAESGTWITHPDYRGQGIGTQGVEKLVELGKNRWNPLLIISTHKRMPAFKVSTKLGFEDVAYKDFPYTSFLTCTCENCSERAGFQNCIFRRKTSELVVGANGEIECTLVVSDSDLAMRFEENCRSLHRELGGIPLISGQLNVESFSHAADFFDKVTELAKNKPKYE